MGQKSGAETVTLTAAEIAAHTHSVKGTTANADRGAIGPNSDRGYATVLESEPGDIIYGDAGSLTSLGSGIVTNAGGGQAHDNMQPYLTLNYCIALRGLFPSRN